MELQETRVLIAGAGAAGGFIAARLAEKGCDVSVMTRARRAEQITLRGLSLTSPFGRFRKPVTTLVAPPSAPQQSPAHVPAPSRQHVDEPFDLVVLACRAHLMREAIEQMTALRAITCATVILSLVDGGPHVPAIQRILPLNTVLEGMLEARVWIDADGLIAQRAPEARISVGRRNTDDRIAANVAALLGGRGLVARAVDDIDAAVWARSVYVAAGIGTSVLTRRPLRDALRYHPGTAHFTHMLAEGRRIAEAAGVYLEKRRIERYLDAFALEGEPVMTPPQVTDPGGAGPEAAYLLRQLVARAAINAPTLRCAARSVTQPDGVADVA